MSAGPSISHAPDPTAVAPPRVERRAGLGAWLLALGYFAVFASLSAFKHRHFLERDFDLAIFTEAADHALRGSLWSSIRGMSWLGDHSSFILFALLPIYALFRSPVTLLVVQTAALALGAIPVARLARRELGSGRLATLFAALYLLHPAVGYANLFEFHPETLATPALLFAFEALRAGRQRTLIVSAAIALLAKEDVALPVAAMGLYTWWRCHRRSDGLVLIAMAAASLLVTFALIKPALGSAAASYAEMYKEWGGSAGAIASNALRHPLRLLAALFSTPGHSTDTLVKQQYWLHLLLPVLGLSLLSPLTLAIALPVIFEHFLSSRPQQHTIVYQYAALVTPFVMASAILGLRNLRAAAERMAGATTGRTIAAGVAVLALAAALASQWMFGPLIGHRVLQSLGPFEETRPSKAERGLEPWRERMLAKLPPRGGVVAGFEFLSRLAGRDSVHSLHHLLLGQYTYSSTPFPVPGGVSALIADLSDRASLDATGPGSASRLRQLIALNHLAPVDAAGDLVLYTRAPGDSLELFAFGDLAAVEPAGVLLDGAVAMLGCDAADDELNRGETVRITTYWRRLAPTRRFYAAQIACFGERGQLEYGHLHPLGYSIWPAADWPEGITLREAFRLVLPKGLPRGRYALALRVVSGPDLTHLESARVEDVTGAHLNGVIPLGRFLLR